MHDTFSLIATDLIYHVIYLSQRSGCTLFSFLSIKKEMLQKILIFFFHVSFNVYKCALNTSDDSRNLKIQSCRDPACFKR